MKKYIFIVMLLWIGFLSPLAFSQTQDLNPEVINHHFNFTLPQGDQASLYFTNDNTLIFMPMFTNQEYVHICWAKWKLEPIKNLLKISNADRCSVLNGDYTVTKQGPDLILKDGAKTYTFKALLNN